MSHFKTKRNYHDADISGYRWEGDELILEFVDRGMKFPSEIRFVGVRNRVELNKDLTKRDYRVPQSNVFSIVKTGKKEFTVQTSEPIKIICDNLIEL